MIHSVTITATFDDELVESFPVLFVSALLFANSKSPSDLKRRETRKKEMYLNRYQLTRKKFVEYLLIHDFVTISKYVIP